ncbi:MAG: DNA primase [Bacteroidales bacterium]
MNEEKVIQKEVPEYDFTLQQRLMDKLVELLSGKEWAFAGLQDELKKTGATFLQAHEAIKKAEELQRIEKGANSLYRLAKGKPTSSGTTSTPPAEIKSPDGATNALQPPDMDKVKPVSNAYELVDSIPTEGLDSSSTTSWSTTEWQQALKRSFVKAATDAGCPLKVNALREISMYDQQKGIYRRIEHIEGVMERLADKMKVPPKKRGERFNISVSKIVCEHLESSPDGFLSAKRKNAINCSNGVVVFGEEGDIKFVPHSPEYNFTYCLPTAYDKDAKAPLFTGTLLKGCLPDQADRDTLMEHIGISLAPPPKPSEKILFLLGSGMNGKSTLRKVIVDVLGKENVASVSLPELLHNPNTRRELLDKPLNFPDESGGYEKKYTHEVKNLASESPMQVKTLYKDTVHVSIHCKLIFPINEQPPQGDNTYGGDRRPLILHFPNRFDGGKAKADTTLAQRIIANEASGVLNLILEGRQRYLRNIKEGRPHGYSRTEIIDPYIASGKTDAIPEYAFLANPVGRYEYFDNNGCRTGESNHTYLVVGQWYTSDDMWKAWCDYCKYNNMPATKERYAFMGKVNTWFKEELGYSQDKQGRVTRSHRIDGKPQPAYLFRLPNSVNVEIPEEGKGDEVLSEL